MEKQGKTKIFVLSIFTNEDEYILLWSAKNNIKWKRIRELRWKCFTFTPSAHKESKKMGKNVKRNNILWWKCVEIYHIRLHNSNSHKKISFFHIFSHVFQNFLLLVYFLLFLRRLKHEEEEEDKQQQQFCRCWRWIYFIIRIASSFQDNNLKEKRKISIWFFSSDFFRLLVFSFSF